jgi:hypothetical protein
MIERTAVYLLVGGVLTAGCSIDVSGNSAAVQEEKRFTVGSGTRLQVSTFDGSVEVRSWDQPEVLVQIEKRAASTEAAQALVVNTRQEGDTVVVEAPSRREGGGVGGFDSASVAFRITVPRQMRLDVSSGDGAISVRDVAGALSLRTGDGSVSAEGVDGDLRVHTGDGSISVRGGRGAFDLDSGDGSIDLSAAINGLRISSGDGAVRVDAAPGSVAKAGWTVTTGDGSISVRLPAAIDALVDAHSGDGRVRADWANVPDSDDVGGSFEGRLGNGGGTIRLRTGDGSIDISRQ